MTDTLTIQPITAADYPIRIPITHTNTHRLDLQRLLDSLTRIPNAPAIIHALSSQKSTNPRTIARITNLPIATVNQTLALMRKDISLSGLLN